MQLTKIATILLASGSAYAKQLEWQAAIASFSGNSASFTAVEASPTLGVAFATANFEGDFDMGAIPTLVNSSGPDALVARFSDSPGWNIDWAAHASSTGQVFLHDLSISPDGDITVCGTYFDDVTFGSSGLMFTAAGGPVGFVATVDATSGAWLNAFETPGVEPVSLATLPAGEVVVCGPGALARRYDSVGGTLWNTPMPAGTDWTGGAHIACEPSYGAGYTITREPDLSNQDVALTRIDLSDGSVGWTRRMGSSNYDAPGGVDIAPDGDVRLSFSCNDNQPSYHGNPIPNVPGNATTYTMVGRVGPNGNASWFVPVGEPQNNAATVRSHDLDVDANGNAWLAATIDDNWLVETQLVTGEQTAAIIGVDGSGLVYDLHRQTGTADVDAAAVAAIDPDQVILVGSYDNGTADFGSGISLPGTTDPEGFFSLLEPSSGQSLVVFTPGGGPVPPTIADIRQAVEDTGIQVYSVIDGIAVSGWSTTAQQAEVIAVNNIAAEAEATLEPNGTTADSGYALSWLNDPTQGFPGTFSFDFPETGGEVVVHLIDTAVENPGSWFDGNANLTLGGTTLIRGAGDPSTSSAFEHGTRLLSIVAGPETGVALGTPVTVLNYDVYPNGSTTTSALLADAIVEATTVHLADHPCTPGLICITSTSGSGETSSALSTAIGDAVADGLAVVISAGNDGDNAANYVPPAYGTTDGVICVGASDETNAATSISNTGTPVDFFAPGDDVRTLDYPSPSSGNFDLTDGTSTAAALVTGVAAIHLSVNPWQDPDELETAVAATLHSGSVDVAQLSAAGPSFSLSFSDWADWHGISPTTVDSDSDGDGLSDGFEYIFGLNPCGDDAPPYTTFTYAGGTATFGFTLSAPLYDATDPKNLRDGSSWEVDSSTDLGSWSAASGSFSYGSASDSRIPVTLTDTPGVPKCFYRLDVSYAP